MRASTFANTTIPAIMDSNQGISLFESATTMVPFQMSTLANSIHDKIPQQPRIKHFHHNAFLAWA